MMRIECPHCDSLVTAQIAELRARSVLFQCSECDEKIVAETWLAAAKPEPASTAEQPLCPKCDAALAETRTACASCGLARARFADFETAPPEMDAGLERAWAELVASWDDDDRHESFLSEVARSSEYKAAAQHYREAAEDPEKASKANALLLRIQKMAAAALLSSRPKEAPVEEPFRGVVMLLIAMVVLAGFGGIYVLMTSQQGKGPQTQAAPGSPAHPPRLSVPPGPRSAHPKRGQPAR